MVYRYSETPYERPHLSWDHIFWNPSFHTSMHPWSQSAVVRMAGTSNAALLFDIQVQGNGYMSAFLPNQYWEGLRFQLRNAHKETMSMKPLPRTNPSLTHSLPLWHQMMSFANWFLHVCRTSYDLLLQFPLFLHSKLEWCFRNEHFWPAKLLWETILRSNFHQRHKCFGRERVNVTTLFIGCREWRSTRPVTLHVQPSF